MVERRFSTVESLNLGMFHKGQIDVDDAFWRRVMLVITVRCWRPIHDIVEKSYQFNDSAANIL